VETGPEGQEGTRGYYKTWGHIAERLKLYYMSSFGYKLLGIWHIRLESLYFMVDSVKDGVF
jgi:hypothetical protein